MQCKRCLYDESVPNITFKDGVCNYCQDYDRMDKEYPTGVAGKAKLREIAEQIKKDGKNKPYDCVIGLSGGCDSSYLLHYAVKELGLRPLGVNIANGWDTDIAKSNLKKVTEKLGVDVKFYNAPEPEFTEITKALLKASVPEMDAHSDIALATLWNQACRDAGVKYFLIGHSFRTEGMFPIGWFYFDGKYVRELYGKPFKKFPNLTLGKFIKNTLYGVKQIRPIWYLDYNKEKIKPFLEKEYGWQWYGGHHYENKYTRFHHWLSLEKFGIDQRIVEYAAMIRAGLITKKEAQKIIAEPVTLPKEILAEVKQRLDLTDGEFEDILNAPIRTHKEFKTYRPYFKLLKPFFWLMYKMNRVPYSFYKKYC